MKFGVVKHHFSTQTRMQAQQIYVGFMIMRNLLLILNHQQKQREWITDYFLQTAAYALAHNLQHKTNIKQGVILICTSKFEFQEFIIKDNEFLWFQKKFIERVEKYKILNRN